MKTLYNLADTLSLFKTISMPFFCEDMYPILENSTLSSFNEMGKNLNSIVLLDDDGGPIPNRIPNSQSVSLGIENEKTVGIITNPGTMMKIYRIDPFFESFG